MPLNRIAGQHQIFDSTDLNTTPSNSWYIPSSVTNRRLIVSDSSIEGNRRDYNMLGNQTSGKEGGVQCVMMVVCLYVCMYVYLISYMSDSKGRLKLGLPL